MDIDVGTNGEFHWVEFHSDTIGILQLVIAVPSLVVGRYVAVAAFDGGAYVASRAQLDDGWTQHGDLAISPMLGVDVMTPRVNRPSMLPMAGYDEWYVLDKPAPFRAPANFVSNTNFTLRSPTEVASEAVRKGGWDKEVEAWFVPFMTQMQLDFWRGLSTTGVFAFLGNGFSAYYLAVKDPAAHKLAMDFLS